MGKGEPGPQWAEYMKMVEEEHGPFTEEDYEDARRWFEENCILVGNWPPDAKKWPLDD